MNSKNEERTGIANCDWQWKGVKVARRYDCKLIVPNSVKRCESAVLRLIVKVSPDLIMGSMELDFILSSPLYMSKIGMFCGLLNRPYWKVSRL